MRYSLRAATIGSRTGRGIDIAVIDSGVHAAHPHVGGVARGVGIDASGVEHADYIDRLGHGTAVAAAIREKAPGAALSIVKVFDRELSTTCEALVAALSWARRERVHIINLSLGTANPAHEPALAAEVREVVASGILLIAAGPRDGINWLPGSLPGVLAVELDATSARDACEIEIDDEGRVTVRASGYPRPIPGLPPERNLRGVSFAVANATGFLACVIEGRSPGDQLATALGRSSSASPSG